MTTCLPIFLYTEKYTFRVINYIFVQWIDFIFLYFYIKTVLMAICGFALSM